MSYVDLLAKDKVRDLVMPISVAQYHELGVSGLIPEKTELIEGIIFRKMTKSPLHEFIAYRLYRFFADCLSAPFLVRKEAPLTLAASEPEPDISIARGRIEDFMHRHPDSAELVIEVAVSSLDLDREKAAIYAEAGIAEYWIVLPESRLIERYTQPSAGRYRSVAVLAATQSIDTRCGELRLRDLFGGAAGKE